MPAWAANIVVVTISYWGTFNWVFFRQRVSEFETTIHNFQCLGWVVSCRATSWDVSAVTFALHSLHSAAAPLSALSFCAESKSGRLSAAVVFRIQAAMIRHRQSSRCCDGRERCNVHAVPHTPHPSPPGMDRGLMFPSETKLKDLPPVHPLLLCSSSSPLGAFHHNKMEMWHS